MAKTARIKIDANDLKTLRPNPADSYKLCFARKVNDTYNVVWQSSSDYGPNTTFQWTTGFQAFATKTYQGGLKVTADSDPQSIARGQETTLDFRMQLSAPIDQTENVDPNAIRVINNYGPVHLGLYGSSSLGDQTGTKPMFVTPNDDVMGKIDMTPKETIMVWFSRELETAVMFEKSVSNPVEIDLTHADEATRLYKNGRWSVVSGTELAAEGLGDPGTVLFTCTIVIAGAFLLNEFLYTLRTIITGRAETRNLEVTGSVAGQEVTLKLQQSPNASHFERAELNVLQQDSTLKSIVLNEILTALSDRNVNYSRLSIN